jgi:excisionase family DNA binding protein
MVGGTPDELSIVLLSLRAFADQLNAAGRRRPKLLDQLVQDLSAALSRLEPTTLDESRSPADPAAMESTPLLLTVPEAADLLRCSPRTVERMIAADRLKPVRIGRALRLTRSALDDLVASL